MLKFSAVELKHCRFLEEFSPQIGEVVACLAIVTGIILCPATWR